MPIELFEMLKLAAGLIIITIPGYLWSFIFSKKLTIIERLIFGFILSLSFITISAYFLNIFFDIKLTFLFIIALYLIYALPIIILYLISIYKLGLPKIKIKPLNLKYLMLIGLIFFIFFMIFLPHIINNHYLPFHVDEWKHWTYTKGIIYNGCTVFTNPYLGSGTAASPEIGFHISTTIIHWLSGSNIQTIFNKPAG